MQVSGFTFIRNAITLDYPVVEAIQSVLPLVDEFVVNVGRLPEEDDDGTRAMIEQIASPKIRIIDSVWNPRIATGAYVYAQQTNVALFNCQGQWAIYVQCDEIVHEDDHPLLRDAMQRYAENPAVDALTLWQLNFWGDYQTMFAVRPWRGRRKCWIVKPHHFVLSRGDAANFTVHPKYKEGGRKIRAVQTAARQFHYSHVKSLKAIQAKYANNNRFWSENDLNVDRVTQELYYQRYPKQFLKRFEGSHPAVMADRIASHPISLNHDANVWRTTLTRHERMRLFSGWLIDHTTDRFVQRADYRLVGRHG